MALSKEEAARRKREYNKRWWAEHPQYMKSWRDAHPEYANKGESQTPEYRREYYANHIDEKRSRRRELRSLLPEEKRQKLNDQSKLWHSKNSKWCRGWQSEYNAKYKMENPEKWKELQKNSSRRRRVRKHGGEYEAINYTAIFERDGWRCQLCGCETLREWERNNIWSPELDHIIPLSRGGSHTYSNTQLLCRRCNGKKAAKMPIDANAS